MCDEFEYLSNEKLKKLTGEELNEYLQKLLEEARIAQDSTINPARKAKNLAQQRIAKNRFMMAIMNCGTLSRQTKWRSLANFEDMYNEALNQTLMEIWQKKDDYNPKSPVMAWVNQIFNWRFKDLVKKDEKRGLTNLPKNGNRPKMRSLEDLTFDDKEEKEMVEEEQLKREEDSDAREVRQVVKEDPEGYLQQETIRGYPHATLQVIILMLLEGKKWREISEALNVPSTTASSFYQRRRDKIIIYLRRHLS
ncbi:RNA polymerase sigma factor [Crocosphaera watsonii]|uniref:Sigma-70 family RNA polymerase sigma factor n=3 Tax=Crocosphaera watsonii TaxID=263511 RepID=T2JZD3_CROWT|nr:sigma-70 family RNA polymerase sigma factor [Crocosphaera watsonii]EHJ09410.1 hypothetical protein CWATWH0003_B162 [Crocosphaera watsonii WH 0003]CCQ55025.1 hypothetical protein CWATWH0005_4311 [Crocosphaera watsonii WH 0005]CCQ70401.1 hypothetical protein CWATWH0402_5671 [Crocosphaera watsonii WH 0402]